jgi:subtilase family serine protease
MEFLVALRPRSQTALDRFVAAVSTPASPLYRHFLGQGEFGRRFGATTAAIERVRRALEQLGLEPGVASVDGLTLTVSSSVTAFDAAFRADVHRFRYPTGASAVATAQAVAVPRPIARYVLAVGGLHQLVARVEATSMVRAMQHSPDRRDRQHVERPAIPTGTVGPSPCAGAAATHDYTADLVARAYDLGPLYAGGDLGGGQSVAIYAQSGFASADIQAYQRCYNTNVGISVIPVDGGNSSTTGPFAREAELDIEDVIGLAPHLKHIDVFEAPAMVSDDLDLDTAIAMADDAHVVSISANACESYVGDGQIQAEANEFNQMVLHGQSVLVASGDLGSEACANLSPPQYQLAVNDPASQPLVTAVGGTNLLSTGEPPVSPPQETAWSSSGGGTSSYWHRPYWQVGPGVTNPFSGGAPCGSSSGCREVPDVSANAGYCYAMYVLGKWGCAAGTSAAAPTWAALIALVDASSTSCAKKGLGLLNPALYRLAMKSPGDFNDVTSGNNGHFPATLHYDLATGLGTPVGARLAQSLCPRTKIHVRISGSKSYGQATRTLHQSTGLPAGTHLIGALQCPIPLALNNNHITDSATLPAGSYTIGTGLCTGLKVNLPEKYVLVYEAVHNDYVVARDKTTASLAVSASSVPVGKETTVRFTVTVGTSHHEVLPNPEIVIVSVGSAACKISLTPTKGGGTGSCSLTSSSALPSGTYTVKTRYGGDADLLPSNTTSHSVTVTSS